MTLLSVILIGGAAIFWIAYLAGNNTALKELLRRSESELHQWRECAVAFSINRQKGLEQLKHIREGKKNQL